LVVGRLVGDGGWEVGGWDEGIIGQNDPKV
jgi:hypothetical protein